MSLFDILLCLSQIKQIKQHNTLMMIKIRLRFNLFFSVTLPEHNLPNATQTNNVKLEHS